jgi:hypothetical protein
MNNTPRPHDELSNDARRLQLLLPHNSARSAEETACGQPITAERAEAAEKEWLLSNTPRPYDEISNDVRSR